MSTNRKKLVGEELAKRVNDGDVIGVGTGSTVNAALEEIGKRVSSEGLLVSVVPTSYQSAWLAQSQGLRVLYSGFRGAFSWGFDGADEVDSDWRLIKGGGGALLQEKIMAARCKRYIVIVDDTKLVSRLGEQMPVPVEFVPESYLVVEKELGVLGAQEVTLREEGGKGRPIFTEKGNLIFDARFDEISPTLEKDINGVVGVVENGLFFDYADEVLVGEEDGVRGL